MATALRLSGGAAGDDGGFAFALLVSAVLHLATLLLPLAGEPPRGADERAPLLVRLALPQAPAAASGVLPTRPGALPGETGEAAGEPTAADAAPPDPIAGVGLVRSQFRRPAELSTPPGLHTVGSLEADAAVPSGRGTVTIEVFIDEDGQAVWVDLLAGAAPPAFREHVLATFGQARYTPGMLLGRPVKSRIKVEASWSDGADPLRPPR